MIDFIDKTSEQRGTPINRKNLMALQGFEDLQANIIENVDGSITVTENNGDSGSLVVNVITNDDGSVTVTETFTGEKTIVKTTTINSDGTRISGVVK